MENQQLQMFWNYQRQEIEQTTNFDNNELPLSRVKKIMEGDEDGRVISEEAQILFAKACELLILELTTRSWLHAHADAQENERRALQKSHIVAVINSIKILDFLLGHTVPMEEIKEGIGGCGGGGTSVTAAGMSYIDPTIAMVQQAIATGTDPTCMRVQAWKKGLQGYLRTPSAPPPQQHQQLTVAAGVDPTWMYAQQKAMLKQALEEEGATYGGGQGLEGQGYLGTTIATPTSVADDDQQAAMWEHDSPESGAYRGGEGLEGQDPTSIYLQEPAAECEEPMCEKDLEEGATYGGGQDFEGQGYVRTTTTGTQPPPQQQQKLTLAGDIDPTPIYLQEPAQEWELMYQQVLEEGATYGGGQGLESQSYVGTTTATQPPQQQQQQPTLADDTDPTSIYLQEPAEE